MDSEIFSPPSDFVKCCNCGCNCSLVSGSSGTWIRSVKRKYDEFEVGERFFMPGFDLFSNARVQVENECIALRETVSSQQQAIQDLYAELDEERNASSSAANEAMSMILRLQREKAEIQMEARQFKRFAEEKMAHDQQELTALEDLLYKREQVIQSLTCEVQAYKHRLMSYGLTEAEAEGEKSMFSRNPSMVEIDAEYDLPAYDYPPLRCNLNEHPGPLEGDIDVADIEKYVESPHGREHLKNLEHRISQMERNPSHNHTDGEFSGTKNVLEKVVVGHSPRWRRHYRKLSTDSSSSFMGMPKDTIPEFIMDSPKFNCSFKKMECVSEMEDHSQARKMDDASELGDEMSDRIYTIDSVHNGVSYNEATETKAGVGVGDDYVTTPREYLNRPDILDPDLKKLFMRLQALEADRESMRQAIISMRTDKAQLVLLKEIAQHLSKEMIPEKRTLVRKASLLGGFSFMSVFKWIVSFVFWRKKARRSKYMYGLSANNMGLLMVLDKGPRMRQWRCLTSTQV